MVACWTSCSDAMWRCVALICFDTSEAKSQKQDTGHGSGSRSGSAANTKQETSATHRARVEYISLIEQVCMGDIKLFLIELICLCCSWQAHIELYATTW